MQYHAQNLLAEVTAQFKGEELTRAWRARWEYSDPFLNILTAWSSSIRALGAMVAIGHRVMVEPSITFIPMMRGKHLGLSNKLALTHAVKACVHILQNLPYRLGDRSQWYRKDLITTDAHLVAARNEGAYGLFRGFDG